MNRKKGKVLILSHTRSVSNFKIGSHHYANELARIGYDVFYSGVPFTLVHRLLKRDDDGTEKTHENVKNVQLNGIFPYTFKMNRILWGVNLIVEKFHRSGALFNNYDVIICDYPFFYPVLKKLKYKKLIYRPTDDYLTMSGSKVLKYEKGILKLADKVIATSEVVINSLLKRYDIKHDNLSVISNGYEDEKFKLINSDWGSRNGVVYVGALDNRFDFEAMLFAAKKLHRIQFDIYGPADNQYENEIALLKSLPNVSVKGKIEYNDVCNVLNRYKIGILPLNNHPSNIGRSPMKLWEYIACGLNVVYSRIESIEENDIFVKYDSLEDLVSSLNAALIENKNKNDIVNCLKSETWHSKAQLIINEINS